MDINKAREIVVRGHTPEDCPCLCKNDRAKGFIEGYESRDVEVEELQARIRQHRSQVSFYRRNLKIGE
jgi:hypothetical protein